MVHLDLTEEECTVLRHLLALRAQDLSHEIHHTDSRDYRTRLTHEEGLLRSLTERLGTEVAVGVR